MRNVIHTEEIVKEFNTYKVEVTQSYNEQLCRDTFQTFIDGKTLMNISESLEDALKYVPGAIWNREDMAKMIAADPERFAR